MYFVDREKLNGTLQFIEEQTKVFREIEKVDSRLKQAALERVCHTLLDAVLTAGNAMIDGFIMRDPGSYEDIIDILTDEKVITEKMGEQLKTLLPYQKLLVHDYLSVDHQKLLEDFNENLDALIQFPDKIRIYLERELGGVTAFK